MESGDDFLEIKKSIIPLDKQFPFSIDFQTLAPGYDMGKSYHWHECLEISYVKSGCGRYCLLDKIYEMKPGDIIVINNIEPHYLEVYEAGMEQTVMVFDPMLVCPSFANELDYSYLRPFFERGTDFNNRLDVNNPFSVQILENINEMEMEFREKQKGYELMVKARLLMLLTLLVRYFRDPDKLDKASKLNLERIEKAASHINQSYMDDISLDLIAGLFNLSPQHFSTVFKKTTGISFTDYVNKVRIDHSIHLLKGTNKKITHIAMECGFNNTTHYNNIFKKFMGKTPSDFR